MMVNNVTMVEYKYLFSEQSDDKHGKILSLISGVDFDLAFPIVARLNFVVREGKYKSLDDELDFWFGSQSPLVNQYRLRILYGYTEKEWKSLRLLNMWSNLTLLQCFLEVYGSHDRSINPLDNDGTHERLLKAYLLINEIYVANFNSQHIIESIPKGCGLLMMLGLTMTTMLLPYHDLNHIDAADAMISQFIKASYFFQFAETNLPLILEVFLRSYGVSNWREYVKAIFPLVDHALKNNTNGLAYLVVDPNSPRADTSKLFLNALAIESENTGFNLHDFILPRSKPLFQIDSGKFLIIDNLLVYNKMYNSLFFEFNGIIKQRPELLPKIDFKGYLNDEFSESYLSKQVLDTIFHNGKYLKFSGEQIRKLYSPAFSAEPDYYTRVLDEVFVFELKDTFINGVTKQSFNVNRISDELKAKLWYKEIQKKDRVKVEPKAVRQIINNIKRAIANDLPFDSDLKYKYLTFYPILLYIDQSLSTPGINEVVNQWFQTELINDTDLVKVQDLIDVKPLTMIDLDTLIVFQDDFKNGKYDLGLMIRQFWAYKEGHLALGKLGITQALYDSTLSFGAFLRLLRKRRQTPCVFWDFAKLLFDEYGE